MQEKLAEAVMKESQYSSEPELSDTSTEDEEDVQKCPERESKGTKGECLFRIVFLYFVQTDVF